jgi:hypothetical protein
MGEGGGAKGSIDYNASSKSGTDTDTGFMVVAEVISTRSSGLKWHASEGATKVPRELKVLCHQKIQDKWPSIFSLISSGITGLDGADSSYKITCTELVHPKAQIDGKIRAMHLYFVAPPQVSLPHD